MMTYSQATIKASSFDLKQLPIVVTDATYVMLPRIAGPQSWKKFETRLCPSRHSRAKVLRIGMFS